ncbi:P-loop containing nucleoside triphosphate hydrolase protein [Paraphysoderma sedebokerense]|nr:P-loop containing nucleoside triphosphate hydrolase protein [Paraphysoderma sedebokerense]
MPFPTPAHPPASAAPVASNNKIFTIEGDGTSSVFRFLDYTPSPQTLPLSGVIRSYVPTPGNSKTIPSQQLYNGLGRLLSLQYHIQQYNDTVHIDVTTLDETDKTSVYCRYIRYHVLNLLSTFGYQIKDKTAPVVVEGLNELVGAIQKLFENEIKASLETIKSGNVDFESLVLLYQPGSVVRGMTSLGISSGFRVLNTHYQEKRTLFGMEKSFHMNLEFVASLGNHFSIIGFEHVVTNWTKTKHKPISELDFVPVADPKELIDRGIQYDKLALGVNYLEYTPNALFLHGSNRAQSSATVSSGRIMIDVSRAAKLGHYASQGADEGTHALIQITGRYSHLQKERTDALFLFTTIPSELYPIAWPALVGYSFTAKAWAHVLITGLEPIRFNDQAFDALVLDPRSKRLIRSLVLYGGESFDDIIPGKSGGSVFLLHGPPGVGKTLTAEAIAEVLHKPLYYVTMGELGVDPVEMEKKLGQVLDLCAGWNALAILDEADVFLEKRSTSDIVRNAMVCVMLRLLEYHQGILFLTTNRITEFDPAFESRVTVALKYYHLTPDARSQVWRNLLAKVNHDGNIDFEKLGKNVMNGRQIKNAVRLALALAKDSKCLVSQELIEETISITALGREDIKNAEKY